MVYRGVCGTVPASARGGKAAGTGRGGKKAKMETLLRSLLPQLMHEYLLSPLSRAPC